MSLAEDLARRLATDSGAAGRLEFRLCPWCDEGYAQTYGMAIDRIEDDGESIVVWLAEADG